MRRPPLKTAAVLSFIVAALMALVSLGGLLLPRLYQDNLFVRSAYRGNDLVSLVIATPLLVGAVILALRGSRRARLVWPGMLAYTLYNFAFYLFGAKFNSFFLLYVALFALSIYALIYTLLGIDPTAIGQQFSPRTPARWISGVMVLVALILGGMWVATSLSYVASGQVPAMVETVEHPTNITGALDLTFVVSVLVLGSVWLWQRRPWGYVLVTMSAVKSVVYMLALTTGSLFGVRAGVLEPGGETLLWAGLAVLFLIASLVLLGSIHATAPDHIPGTHTKPPA